MCSFILKSYNQKDEIGKPHFFILNKGNNSGKPLLAPCPNCFVIITENQLQTDQLRTFCYALWRCRAFEPHLHGSVIPFMTIRSFRSILAFHIPIIEKKCHQFCSNCPGTQIIGGKGAESKKNTSSRQRVQASVCSPIFQKCRGLKALAKATERNRQQAKLFLCQLHNCNISLHSDKGKSVFEPYQVQVIIFINSINF